MSLFSAFTLDRIKNSGLKIKSQSILTTYYISILRMK